MPAANQAKTGTAPFDALYNANFTDAQARATRLFARANALAIGMARSLWESQTELLQFETEQAARALEPAVLGGDPGEALAAYSRQWHDTSERLVADLRQVNDLVRDYGWQVMEICADGMREAAKPLQHVLQPKA